MEELKVEFLIALIHFPQLSSDEGELLTQVIGSKAAGISIKIK